MKLAARPFLALAAALVAFVAAGQESPEQASALEGAFAKPTLEETHWKLIALRDVPIQASSTRSADLTLAKSGLASGFGGCNRWQGPYTLDGDKITFSQVVSTMMACPEGGAIEPIFLDALAKTARWRIAERHLELLDTEGKVLARFVSGP